MNVVWPLAVVVIKELYRRKDFYVLFVLTALISVVMGSVNFFNTAKIARYLQEICLALIWVSSIVIAITTTARQIPAERENRTIFPLLAKPVTRANLLLGKFLGCWLACGFCLLVFYVFFGVLSATRSPDLNWLQLAEALLLHWLMLAMLVAMVLLGSVVFAAPSSNGTICFVVTLGILLLGRHLNKVALQLAEPGQTLVYAIYFAIPHFEIFDVRDMVIHQTGLVPGGALALAVVYAAAYCGVFLLGAWLVFRRQPVN